jgi:photosystem II stability/assembly factor-like uncharacterized protein
MNSKNTIITALLILALSVLACSLPKLTPTEVVPTSEPTTLEETVTLDTSGAIPLPPDLSVIVSPSLVYIDFQDTQNGWAIGTSEGGYILRTQDSGNTWLKVTPPGMAEVSYSTRLFVLDVNTAWALIPGDDFYTGSLYRTLDGGASWTSNTVPFSGGDLQFLDTSTGRILADRGAGAGSNAVELYQTSDGGVTWTSVFHNDPSQSGSSDSLPLGGIKSGMTFIDADTGWVTGSRPMEGDIYLYVTHDGGRSWVFQAISIPADLANCQFNTYPPIFFGEDGFLPIYINFYSGPVEQVFYITHDGGASWAADPTSASQVVVPAGQYVFADALHGFSWNGGPDIIFTTDGAQTWSGGSTDLDLSDSLWMIDFIDGSMGWALTGPGDSGMAALYQTLDGGHTWTQLIP